MNLEDISHCRPWWDEYKCPVKPDQNGGDVLHRCGLQAFEWWLKTQDNKRLRRKAKDAFQQQLYVHSKGNGNYARHWKDGWWNSDRVFSRDQSIPIIIACGLFGLTEHLEEIYQGLKANTRDGISFYPNTMINGKPDSEKIADIVTPQIWALFDRAKGFRTPTGSICDGDRAELADSHVVISRTAPPKIWIPWPVSKWTYPLGKPQLHNDPINKTMILLFNKVTYETRDAQLARQIYAKKGRVWESWKKYWIRDGDPQCPFHEVFEPYVKALGQDRLI